MTTRLTTLTLFVCAALLGCPPAGTGEVELDSVSISGVGTNREGRFRLTLTGVTARELTATVTATEGATFPATVVIPPGVSVVEGTFTVTGTGGYVATFVLGSRTVPVAGLMSGAALSSVGGNRLQAGASSYNYVYFTDTLPENTTVSLSSSDPSVVQVPASVVVPAFRSSAPFNVKAGTTGSAVITATTNGVSVTGVVYVTAVVALSSFGGTQRAVVGGVPPTVTVSLSAVTATDVPVTLTSSTPATATLPSTALIRAGTSQVAVPVTVVATGATILTAEAVGGRRQLSFSVLSANGLRSLSCNGSATSGSVIDCYVFLDLPASQDTVLTLDSSTPTVVAAPATLTVPAGTEYFPFQVNALTPGSAVLSATLGAASRTATLQVRSPSAGAVSSMYLANNGSAPGTQAQLNIYLNTQNMADVPVSITSSNPLVMAPPAVAVIPAFTQSLQLSMPFLAVGMTKLTVTALGSSTSMIAHSTNATSTYANLNGGNIELGSLRQLSISLGEAAQTDLVIPLTTNMPSVLDVPASVTIRQGESYAPFVVTALAAGTTIVSATVNGQTFASETTVVATPTLNSFSVPGLTVGGISSSMYLSFDCSLAADRVLTLSQNGTGSYVMPSTVVIGTGDQGVSVTLRAAAAGPVTVTATTGQQMGSAQATLVQP